MFIATIANSKKAQKIATNTGKIVATAAVGLVAYRVVGNYIDAYRRKQVQFNIESSPSARQAQQLKIAMNPSGFDWMFSVDGTNERLIFATAQSIDNFAQVQRDYNKLYTGRNLVSDLESELSAESLSKFYGLMQATQIRKIASKQLSPKSGYRYKQGDRVSAKGRPFLFAFPEKGQEQVKILETNAPLGVVANRLKNKAGTWYLVDLGGFSGYIKEQDLL